MKKNKTPNVHSNALVSRLLMATSLAIGAAEMMSRTVLAEGDKSFDLVTEWPVADNGSDVAEILAASENGQLLIYTDSPGDQLGFVDITDPKTPNAGGVVPLPGEPTSVATAGDFALVGVNTSGSYKEPSGLLAIIDLRERSIIAECDVGGQPDAVAVSPDGSLVAIAVENERDEDLNDGVIPQLPAGHLAVFDLDAASMPTNCDNVRKIEMTGMAAVAGDDPEPEFVAINQQNLAVVTLQENNHLIIADLPSGRVMEHFTAGSVSLEGVDLTDDGKVDLSESAENVAREPDAVAWIDGDRFVTANEGDYEGGGRGFTIFDRAGTILWDSGNETEHRAAEAGVYPDSRSGKKGTEPETVAVTQMGGNQLIFVALERANSVAVYELVDEIPVFRQLLLTGIGPEGILPLPERDLLAIANEADPEEGLPSTISLFSFKP